MNTKRKIRLFIGAIAMLIGGYFALDSLLFDGVRPRPIQEQGFQANFFAHENILDKPAIIVVGGGHWGDYWGQIFAKNGYVGLSIPYYRQEGLPDLLEEIPLEYFEKAINWVASQPEVDPRKVIVMGASRNAELALVIASTFPDLISGVIAYAPSSVSWSNTVLPFNSDEMKPSWTYGGNDIPYLLMEKISPPNGDKIETISYWKSGLLKIDQYQQALIPVEKIAGPILLFSGTDDQVWPAALMCDMIEQRLAENNFEYKLENIQYENAGHLISRNAQNISSGRVGSMELNGKKYEFEYGGTVEGDLYAITDSHKKILDFMKSIDAGK